MHHILSFPTQFSFISVSFLSQFSIIIKKKQIWAMSDIQ
jgi:hypothetical protein